MYAGAFKLVLLPMPSWKCSLPPQNTTSAPQLVSFSVPWLDTDNSVTLSMIAEQWVAPTDRDLSRIGHIASRHYGGTRDMLLWRSDGIITVFIVHQIVDHSAKLRML